MLAFIGSRLGLYALVAFVIALAIGGVVLHFRLTQNTLDALRHQVTLLQQQADSYKLINAAIEKDLVLVQQQQQSTLQTLQAVQSQASALDAAIRKRTFVGNPTAIQARVNKETKDALRRIQDAARS